MIKILLAVGLGGATGSILRFVLLSCMRPICANFPYDILFINIIGSFLIGLFATSVFSLFSMTPLMYATIVTGFLGGFTTFSSFSLSVITLIEQGASIGALLYICASVVCSICATWLGIFVAK